MQQGEINAEAWSMKASDLISIDPEIMGGTRCFRGTRVPVSVLFENLADGLTVDEILESWSSLNQQDVLAVLALASGIRTEIDGRQPS